MAPHGSVWSAHRVLFRLAARVGGLGETTAPQRERMSAWLHDVGVPLRLVPSDAVVGSYEAAIAAGELPVRDGSWHDAFNVLAFACFPAAKTALHRRVYALQRARSDRMRTREEDALTLVDECALLMGGDAVALARLSAARARGSLVEIDAVVRGEGIVVECFGHALLEHLLWGRPPIGAGVVPLCIEARSTAALDAALADAITQGFFDTPRLSPTVPWPDPIVDGWFGA